MWITFGSVHEVRAFRERKGVEEIRVVRGKAVIDQFGAGTKFEVPRDEIEIPFKPNFPYQ